jgi:hypothetical protein
MYEGKDIYSVWLMYIDRWGTQLHSYLCASFESGMVFMGSDILACQLFVFVNILIRPRINGGRGLRISVSLKTEIKNDAHRAINSQLPIGKVQIP